MVNGGAISVDGLKDRFSAIVEAFMPGVHGGTAIAETLLGDSNPGGKLPVTIYHSDYINQVDFLSMDMNNGVGRSYKYYTGTPMWAFGFGLSYTTFSLAWSPRPPPSVTGAGASIVLRGPKGATTYSVKVTNTGTVDGDEVVLAFFKPNSSSRMALATGAPVPKRQLFGFQRVHLVAGESNTLEFTLTASQLALVDNEGNTVLVDGGYSVMFSRGHGEALTAAVTVVSTNDAAVAPGTTKLKTLRKWW
jgi:hypothetical protein